MHQTFKKIFITGFLLLGCQVMAQDALWLSSRPPESMKEMVKASGMHRLPALDYKKIRDDNKNRKSGANSYQRLIKDSAESKETKNKAKIGKRLYRPTTQYIQWIRKGNSIKDSKYICIKEGTDYELYLMSPDRNKEKIGLIKGKVCFLKFELKEEGYYNVYLKLKEAQGDTLNINIAKAELLNHSCRNGHHKRLEARPVEVYPEITDFEVIRVRTPHESYHYFSTSGNRETYKALYLGEPVKEVKVTINTEKGWSKTFFTDESGEINIQFIQDYFSEWKELEHRKIFYYMLKAEYTIKKDIKYKGKDYSYIHYTLTMSDGYRPSKTMYTSMLWGLMVFVITLIISISGIYLYKERRKKPYKEITFKES